MSCRSTRLALAGLLVAALMPVAAVGAPAGDPRREQERLNARDMALARSIAVRPGDVGHGWSRMPIPAGDGQPLRCAGFDPDFSRFTITGKARSAFTGAGGRSIVSLVEVYRDRGQAIGDFRLGATPAAARCLSATLERQFAQASTPGLTLRVRSTRTQALRVGERAIAFRLVAVLDAGGVSAPVYLDVLAFQRGRSIAAVMFTSAFDRIPGQLALARAIARRMR